MSSITFITAVAPYHTDLLPLAIESVQRQTVKCEHIIFYDTLMQGAGYARNQALAQVKTDFTAFLDADDQVLPAFAEHTLRAFDGTHYIYTDFIYDGKRINSPDKDHYITGNDVFITGLIPTVWLRDIGGFDESLRGAEDTKLYLSLQATRRCGKRLAEPLFVYGKAGRRAAEFVNSMFFEPTMSSMIELRGEAMACCGENEDMPQLTEPAPGDVLARSLWGGNRQVFGMVTRRDYGRTGNGTVISIDPEDLAAMPQMFQRVEVVPPPAPFVPTFKMAEPIGSVDEAAKVMFGTSPESRVMTAAELRAIQPAKVAPDVAKVQALRKTIPKGRGKGRR